jgi:hypothetical protein
MILNNVNSHGPRYEVTLLIKPGEFPYKFMAITDTKIYYFCDNN